MNQNETLSNIIIESVAFATTTFQLRDTLRRVTVQLLQFQIIKKIYVEYCHVRSIVVVQYFNSCSTIFLHFSFILNLRLQNYTQSLQGVRKIICLCPVYHFKKRHTQSHVARTTQIIYLLRMIEKVYLYYILCAVCVS